MSSARSELLKIADFEQQLWDCHRKMAMFLDYACGYGDCVEYSDQYAMAERLWKLVQEAERLANKLWRELREDG